jgi:hypothetical protein
MGKLATWAEVNSRVGSGGTPAGKCPTKAEVLATGKATVAGSYASNQLVQLVDVNTARSDNKVSVSATITGNREGTIRVAAAYPVASSITVYGSWTDDMGGRGTFSVLIGAGEVSGYTTVYLSSSYIQNVNASAESIYPAQDDTYNYIIS